jgi:hypothetical protein
MTETVLLSLSNVDGSTLGQTSSATLAITDNDSGGGSLEFTQAGYSVNESGAQVTLSVSRTGGAIGQATVDYATQNGQAIAGTDYSSATGTLTWADSDTADKTFSVSILNDTNTESAESFSIALSNPQGASVGNLSSATVTISDDDDNVAVAGGGGGGRLDYFTLVALLLTGVFSGRRRQVAIPGTRVLAEPGQ